MAMTPKERRAQMIRERGKTESTGINPNSPRARLEKQKTQTTKRSSITPKERRAQTIASRGDNFFTRKRTPLRTGKKAQQIARAQADVEKDLPRGTPSPQAMEDYKPTATAKAITKTETTMAKSPAKSKPGVGGVKAGLSEFGKAFAAARKAGKKDFTFRDKQYAAVTKQEVSKAGASGLGDYLNKLKRSETKIAKAPGQITKKKGGMTKFNVGGEAVSPKEMRRIRLKEMSGAAVSENEMKSIMEQMGKSPAEDKLATGGSVMARGCKIGKKKPTKLY
jgi:hypothetical protein